MSDPLIVGGYILLSRKIIESEIWSKPPLYLKIWVYLLSKAQHKQYKQLNRGQLRVSIPEIMEECSWYVGYRKVKPTKDQVFQIIDWLRKPCEGVDESNMKATMITTTKATQGLLVEIVNYNVYQDSKNYESNKASNDEKVTEATREQRQHDNINKNDKNEKNEKNVKEDIYILTDDENKFLGLLESIPNYPADRNKDLAMYETLREKYPTLNLLDAIENWKVYKIDKPLETKSNPRSQINTSFKNYVAWGKCLKGGNENNGKSKGNSGTSTNRGTTSEETIRLERIARETGLLDEQGRCGPIPEVDF